MKLADSHRAFPGFFLCLLALGLTSAPSFFLKAKEPPAKDEKQGDTTELTAREAKILELFTTSQKTFKSGRVLLEYDFETQNQDLVQDWLPALEKISPRVRWARGAEGTMTTVEHGILIGDKGEWIHKAVFLPDVEVKAELLPLSHYKKGTIVGPVFYSEKKKASLGSSCGYQAVYLKGWTMAKPPIPNEDKAIQANERFWVGYKYDGKVFECYHANRKTSDTSKSPKFTDGFDSGHAGLAWGGSIQSFVFKVTIEGKLDPDWVAKQLNESGSDSKSTDKKASDKKTSEKAAGDKKTGTKKAQ